MEHTINLKDLTSDIYNDIVDLYRILVAAEFQTNELSNYQNLLANTVLLAETNHISLLETVLKNETSQKELEANRETVATKFPALPANVSYNTQMALNEPPLDVSNVMD
ncbi:hypothetical protein DSO57_1031937 [Entomophthora muscae]|uniref:Uncharacterized protein n=1 Tax=Entomophthora muscae TaxID=34485 RepID=A0ACC2T0Q4_9FUNG|nr:hypothetical protein DSO57_1031937 [Entomophthora muscae]